MSLASLSMCVGLKISANLDRVVASVYLWRLVEKGGLEASGKIYFSRENSLVVDFVYPSNNVVVVCVG